FPPQSARRIRALPAAMLCVRDKAGLRSLDVSLLESVKDHFLSEIDGQSCLHVPLETMRKVSQGGSGCDILSEKKSDFVLLALRQEKQMVAAVLPLTDGRDGETALCSGSSSHPVCQTDEWPSIALSQQLFHHASPCSFFRSSSFKFTVLETLDRIKEEFQFLQAQYHSLKLECEKLASEKTEMQRHYIM
ncbi:hypothetical protein KUCAC02_022876, partial [Chaenocephalus aceratus]